MITLKSKKDKVLFVRVLKKYDLYTTFIQHYNEWRYQPFIYAFYAKDNRCQDIYIFLEKYYTEDLISWIFNHADKSKQNKILKCLKNKCI